VLLRQAVHEPGRIHAAYTAFHPYSFGNQLLALFQCTRRGLDPGPIATYQAWQEKGRQVRKGERALTLCQPFTLKRQGADEDDDETRTGFVFRPRWFIASQTDGEPITSDALPTWDRATALTSLSVTEVPFALFNGNVQGFAHPDQREIAINPVAGMPLKTTLHELAHVLLHSDNGQADDQAELPPNLQEVEAEAVTLLLTEALGLPGADYCRGYLQSWLDVSEIPDANARRIFAAADRILRAGSPDARRET